MPDVATGQPYSRRGARQHLTRLVLVPMGCGCDIWIPAGFLNWTPRVFQWSLGRRWQRTCCAESRFLSTEGLRRCRGRRQTTAIATTFGATKLVCRRVGEAASGGQLEDRDEALWEALERDVSEAETVGKLPPPLRTELLSKIREFVERVAHRQAALGAGVGEVSLPGELVGVDDLWQLPEGGERVEGAADSGQAAAGRGVNETDSPPQHRNAQMSLEMREIHAEEVASGGTTGRRSPVDSGPGAASDESRSVGSRPTENFTQNGRGFAHRATAYQPVDSSGQTPHPDRQGSGLYHGRAPGRTRFDLDTAARGHEYGPHMRRRMTPLPRDQTPKNQRTPQVRNESTQYMRDAGSNRSLRAGRDEPPADVDRRMATFRGDVRGLAAGTGSEDRPRGESMNTENSQFVSDDWGQPFGSSEVSDRRTKDERMTEPVDDPVEDARMRYAQFRGMLSLALREISEYRSVQRDRRDPRIGRLSSMLDDAISLLNEAGIEKLVTTSDINDLLSCLGRLRLLNRLEEVFELTELRGVLRDNRTYSLVIGALCKAKRIDAAIEIFENYVVRAAAQEAMSANGRHQRTNRVYPTIVMYNMLIAGCARTLRLDKAFEFFERMQSPPDNFTPDSYTYCALLDACAKCNNTELALHVFDEIERKGSRVDGAVYGALMGAVARSGDRRLAFAIWGLMQRRGLTPSNVIFVYLMEVCAADGDYLRGFELLREMSAWNRTPNLQIYTSLMNACGRGGQPEYAMAVLERMKLQGISPSEASYCVLIEAWSHIRRLDRAFGVLRDMRADGVEPRMRTANALLTACWRCRNLQAAHWLYAALRAGLYSDRYSQSMQVEDLDLKLWAHATSVLIELACDAGDYHRAVITYLADAFKLGVMQTASLRSVLRPSLNKLRDALFRDNPDGDAPSELQSAFLNLVGSEDLL